ncbi:MAG: branched-chain amino acid ABC transporter permease [Betaproteobacteria bacterium]|nr:branched-chain amino acid ABC transporter permease [Betaproteobacteria bacterium]
MIGSRDWQKDSVWALLGLLVLLALPWFSPSRVVTDFIIRLCAMGLLATSLNMLVGYGGMVSFGHAMFFGSGAYVFSLMLQKASVSVPVALLSTIVFSALLAALIGAICVRLKGIYFSFLTLAFQMLLHSVIITWTSMTGGDQGLTGGIPRPVFLGIDLSQASQVYVFCCVLAVLSLLAMRLLMQSPFGYTLRMLRDNEDRAAYLGIDVWRVRLYAFILAGVFAGLGGVIMALFVSGAFPDFSYWTMSGEAVFMIMMGGIHVFIGPLLGAGLLQLFNDTVTRYTPYHGLALGIVILLFTLGFQRGITDVFKHWFKSSDTQGGR